ncbi:phospholipase B-like 1 isoform X2 [Entelurus aequoreus]|uniref:phospholipase B-like 1 isoform X2 n=1 Tax=Entelurus aequoreus TaxID=161455 RepID=UPI002B1DE080|nr:phospholipase B-like 1 isoform X2 [Entelurus aequoreus]
MLFIPAQTMFLTAFIPAQTMFLTAFIPAQTMFLTAFSLLLFFNVASTAGEVSTATVYWNVHDKTVLLKEDHLGAEGDAYGFFNNTLTTTGWSVLEVRAGYGDTPPSDQLTFYLAGYLEGFLTAQQMEAHYTNMYPQLITDPTILGPLHTFIKQQDSWTREQVKSQKSSDPVWTHTGFIVAQMDGLQAGAAEWAKRRGKKFLNAVGDLLDLIPNLVPSSAAPLKHLKLPGMGHCSALIKLLPGFENLLFAHSSWYTYAATMRIYKHWDFHISEPHTATGKLSFSSYPGFLVSLDDFYLLGSGLMMTQTTNNVFNSSLFRALTPKSLLAWQRVRLAHSLAHTGEEWASIFSKYNSGTYNNQYMVLDRSKVKLGHSISDGALTVVEQIPGLVEYSDQTQALRLGYWPSYNVPFHQNIYRLSGYQLMWQHYGQDFSYDLCPRAKIFRRDQAHVKDLDSLKHIMRFNDYKKDPYSQGNPCKSICCRNDLKAEEPSPGGCYDTKVTDFQMAGRFQAQALNGPTTQDGLPPFRWEKFSQVSHQGLPAFYNFTFVSMQPVLFRP